MVFCYGLYMVSRIVIYFVVIHNNFFEHFCVARYWHDESSCTTLAQLKMTERKTKMSRRNLSPTSWRLYSYPKTMIKKHWRSSPMPTPHPSKDMLSIVLPYDCHLAESIHWILTPMNVCVCFCLHQTLRHCTKTALYLRSEQELSTKFLVRRAAERTLGKPAGHWTNR